MKHIISILVITCLVTGCGIMKKLEDGVFIQQRTTLNEPSPRVDSLLIVANGNSATQRIMDDFISLFRESLNKRGINSSALFVSYSDRRIDESQFDNRNYSYTLWIYEQDRKMQQLEGYDYLVPLAMKLTDNKNDNNLWIATSIINNIIRNKFYRERYAGTLVLLFRANGFIK
jgi:hypothetical protein